MKAAFYTLGCKVNQYETQNMIESLEANGFEICGTDASADVFILNSCTVTAESDRKTRQLIRKYRTLLPHAVIVLTGCLPQAFPDDAEALEQADILLGNTDRRALIPAIEEFMLTGRRVVQISPHTRDEKFMSTSVRHFHERTRAFVKIEDGCNRYCAYCIIPYARGTVRSKPLEDIEAEVAGLARSGYKEIVLVGINLSAYGLDTGSDLSAAVQRVCAVDGIERVRLGSLEPDLLTDDMIVGLAGYDKLCQQFHLSLQSGCDETLKRMNRRYSAEYYVKLIGKLRNAFDNCAVTTDIMVGFPGESDREFSRSLELFKSCRFARAHVFAYSRRKGTPADTMPGQISKSEKQLRSGLVQAAAQAAQRDFLSSQAGKTLGVLIETRHAGGSFEGYSENYTKVRVPSQEDLLGKIVYVNITSAFEDHCEGVLVNNV